MHPCFIPHKITFVKETSSKFVTFRATFTFELKAPKYVIHMDFN